MTTLTNPQKPPKFSPAYNELVYVVKRGSDHSTEDNYRFICELYDGAGTTLIAKLKQYPLADDYGVFDLHRILENYVSFDCSINNVTGGGFEQNTHSYKSYLVKLGEEYGDLGAVTEHLAIITDSKRYAYNGIFDFLDFPTYDPADWTIASGTTKKFLTNSPRTRNIRLGEKDWLYFFTDTAVVDHVAVVIYDSAGTNSTQLFTNIYSGLASDDDRFLRVRCGPGNLNSWILSTTLYYTVQLRKADNSVCSELFRFNLTSCGKYTVYRLHFMNKMGGFDSFDFTMKSRNSIDISRSSYKQVVGTELAGGYSYSKGDRGHTNYDIQIKPKLQVESDWITDADAVWLEEIVTSPVVFWEQNSSTLVAVNIETASWEQPLKANSKVINLKLDLSYSFDKTRQRG